MGKQGRPRKSNFSVSSKNGKKYSYVRVTAVIDGEQRQFTGKTREEAELKRDREMKVFNVLHGKSLFGDWAEEWINEIYIPGDKNAIGTKRRYVNAWRNYLVPTGIYDAPLLDVTSLDIQKAFNSMSCTNETKRKVFNLLRKFYRYLSAENICRDITMSLVAPERDIREANNDIEIWTEQEIDKILNSFDKAQDGFRLKGLVYLALGTGLRFSELLALKDTDLIFPTTADGFSVEELFQPYISVSRQLISTGNGFELAKLKSKNSARTIPIDKVTMTAYHEHTKWMREDKKINGYENPERFLFLTKSGKYYDKHNVARSLGRYYKKIGVPNRGFHTYRRTYATRLCRAGVPIDVASKLLGHSDISVTAKYYVSREYSEISQLLRDHGLDY